MTASKGSRLRTMTGIPDSLTARAVTGTRRSTWLTALGIGVAVAMLALGSFALVTSRNDTWTLAQQNAENLLLALDRDIGRNLTILDLSLQGLVQALQEPGLGEVSDGIRHHALFDQAASAEDLGSMLVLDETGEVVEDSTAQSIHKLNLGDRDYFRVHRDDPEVGMYISRVFKSRLLADDLRFAISRRLSDADEQFSGVAIATLRLSYFKKLFEKLRLGANGTISLVRMDGHVVVRYPFNPADVDRDISAGATFSRLLGSPAGQYVAKASIDGIERLYTFRRVGNLPLVLTVNLSTEEIFAPWRSKAVVIGPVLLLLCACVIASSLLFRREVTRRAATEAALEDAAQKLAIIASTDGLTGLANRRTFDLEFDRAFRRALRTGRSLSVLMLDADWFKRYNDTYGHPAGDKVLRVIAACLSKRLRRPDDLSARYGGEEFIALMPDTNLEAARSVAEQLRLEIEQLALEHSESGFGFVTVSIGVASVSPSLGFESSVLIEGADRALYEAKRDGRNRVRAIEVPLGEHGAPSLLQLVATVTKTNCASAAAS